MPRCGFTKPAVRAARSIFRLPMSLMQTERAFGDPSLTGKPPRIAGGDPSLSVGRLSFDREPRGVRQAGRAHGLGRVVNAADDGG